MNKRTKGFWIGWLILLPHLGGVVVFYLYPFLWSVIRSFNDASGLGFSNYSELFHNAAFQVAVLNTLLFTCLTVPLLVVLAMAVALSVHNTIRGSIWLLHSFVLYYAIPTASIAYSWTLLFGNSGIVNRVVHEIFGGFLINWLDGSWLFVPLVSFFLIKYCAYPILILLGGLQAIPGDLYEAAAIDGASFMRKTRWITIPLLLPELSFIALLGFFYNFKIYKEAYAMFGAYPPRSIYLVQHFMNNNFIQLNLNRLVASSTLTAAVAALLILILVRMNRSAYEP